MTADQCVTRTGYSVGDWVLTRGGPVKIVELGPTYIETGYGGRPTVAYPIMYRVAFTHSPIVGWITLDEDTSQKILTEERPNHFETFERLEASRQS